jgi:hypothetical protein
MAEQHGGRSTTLTAKAMTHAVSGEAEYKYYGLNGKFCAKHVILRTVAGP